MNKFILSILVPVAITLSTTCLNAQEEVRARIDQMEKELQELKQTLKLQEEKATQDQQVIHELKARDDEQQKKIETITKAHEDLEKRFVLEELYGPKKAEEFAKKGLSPQFGGIYTKPFLRRMGRNTYLGGYMDASFRSTESANDRFEVLRFVPFIYSDVSDRVKLASEIEFEHGGAGGQEGVLGDAGDTEINGEVKLEFATVDFLIKDWVNMRAGLILVPLGKFNLVHDAPLQDLVDRPLVDTNIIPTTLTQAGMGFYGTFYPTELSKLDYEIYATNGFGNDINSTDGIRGARLFRFDRDNNQSPEIVARVGFSPFLGLELGGSALYNKYSTIGDDHFTITALDFAYQKGPFELVGEGAYVGFERGKDVKIAQTGVPSSMFGYYIEPRFHFMPKVLHDLAPTIFTDRSTFTLTTRWDQIDLGDIENSAADTRGEGGRANRRDRATFGINYRYTEDTVFKLDYQINIEHSQNHVDNNAFLFGVATYF